MRQAVGIRLRAEEAGPMLHALIARLAGDIGIRALAIKGPVAAIQGLRAPRTYADVDVLVDPEQRDALVRGLKDLGWREAVPVTAPMIMPAHSVSLLSDLWPACIDLHHYFPGFLADAGEAFEALWQRHVDVVLAGVPVASVDPVGQAAVVALHLLRDSRTADNAVLRDLVQRTQGVLAEEGIQELVHLADATDATDTLRPFLLALGVSEEGIASARNQQGLELWTIRTHASSSTVWLRHFARTPKHRWPAALWHALMLTDEEILASNSVARGQACLARLRVRRIRRGLPGVTRELQSRLNVRRAAGR